MYDEQLSYDAVGNVTKTNTTLPAGTDNQAFCYDEQNRLTWSGSTGTPTCSTAITTGTLPTYQQSYGYDVLDRLTQGPAGNGYTYGDSAHLNAVTSANGYTTAYDSDGNMTCRAKNGSGQSCTPTAQHGQLLTYDALGRMLTWQSSSSASPSTESDAYDGEGHRVQRVTTPGGSTTPTTTTFVGSNEEVSVTSGTTTTIKYYAAGPVQVESINGSFSYLIQDHLGSVAIEMGSTGNLRGQQLFTPYGAQRYSSGFFNSNDGFTDQYTDSNNGLDYYGARYYDPVVGQFVSGDTAQGPNRYGYVGGNPETFTDPTGHDACLVLCNPGVGSFNWGAWGAAAGEALAGAAVVASAPGWLPIIGAALVVAGLTAVFLNSGGAIPASTHTCAGGACATAAPTPTPASHGGAGGGTSSGIGHGLTSILAAAIAALVVVQHPVTPNTVTNPVSSKAASSPLPGYASARPLPGISGSHAIPPESTSLVHPATPVAVPNWVSNAITDLEAAIDAHRARNLGIRNDIGGAVVIDASGTETPYGPIVSQGDDAHVERQMLGKIDADFGALLAAGGYEVYILTEDSPCPPCTPVLQAAESTYAAQGNGLFVRHRINGRGGIQYGNNPGWKFWDP